MKLIETVDDLHTILLGIAKAFHKICTENNIPYYMLGGTMLGAVRHKGFIPWDDDMDFGVPREYYSDLILLLEKELPYPYRCNTYKNNPSVYSVIVKIDDTRTIADDPCVRMPLEQKIGVNIDIFPLDFCEEDDPIIRKIRKLELVYQTVYVGNLKGKKWKNMLKNVLSTIFPISRTGMLDYIHKELSNIKKGPMLANVFGAWKEKECVPFDWYGYNTKYVFEDTEFYGIREFDKYLTKMYGDYMTPPKGDKHLHLKNVYWK